MSDTGDVSQVREMDPADMMKEELLTEIGRIVGFRGFSRTQLRKQDLNSVHWYLTGSVVARWMKFQTEKSPSYMLLRRAVADALELEFREIRDGTRPFRVGELQEIVEALREQDDLRQHSHTDDK